MRSGKHFLMKINNAKIVNTLTNYFNFMSCFNLTTLVIFCILDEAVLFWFPSFQSKMEGRKTKIYIYLVRVFKDYVNYHLINQ